MKRRILNLLKDDEFLASVFALFITLVVAAVIIMFYRFVITEEKITNSPANRFETSSNFKIQKQYAGVI